MKNTLLIILLAFSLQVSAKESKSNPNTQSSQVLISIWNDDSNAMQVRPGIWQQFFLKIIQKKQKESFNKVERIGSIYDSPSDSDGD